MKTPLPLRALVGGLTASVLLSAAAFQGVPVSAASASPLVIDQSTAPVSLNPVFEADWNTRESIGYLYDPLVYAGPNNTYLPGLAVKWTPSNHNMVWTIQLRKGVKFQDGTPFNAAAAVYNFNLNFNPKSNNYSDFKPYVKSVTAAGPYTIKITLAQADAELLDELTWAPLFVSPTAYKKEGATNFAQHPVGTGAYVFQSYQPNSNLIMTANPNYWGGKPQIPEIKVQIVPDLHTEALNLEAHTADFMYGVQPQDVPLLKSHGINVVTTPTASGAMVSFNVAKGPTADVQVRKAIMFAINRQAINKVVLKGYAEITRAGIPTTSPWYHANVPNINFSPSKAEAMLNADGWKVGKGGVRYKNGQPLSITILSNSNEPWPMISQIFQQELSQVGFKANIVSQDWGTFLNSMRAGDYNIAYWYLAGFTMPSWDGTVNLESTAYWNVSQIKNNPQLKSAMQQIDKLYNLEIGQSNVKQRSATLLKFQQLNAKYQIVGYLWNPLAIFGVSPKLHGYQFNNWQYLFLDHNSTLSK